MRLVAPFLLLSLAACEAPVVSPERAAEICEERARAAQAPTGNVTVGTNSRSGVSAGLEVGISSDLLAGRDPLEVYNECVFDRTGTAPIRPPVLR